MRARNTTIRKSSSWICCALLLCSQSSQSQTQTHASADHAEPATIAVDLGKRKGPCTPIYSWFGYDEANYTTMPHGRALLRELHDLTPVPYTVWQRMGSPQQPTPEQYAALRQAGKLELLTAPTWRNVHNSRITVLTSLPREGTSLLHLRW